MPTQFMAKRWIFVVQAIIFGGLASFSLIFGQLFLFGLAKNAKGAPATEAGIALTAMSLPLSLVFALSLYNLIARRRPLLRIYREGIEIIQIGSSSLDRIPLIPVLIRVAWLILSTEGFRQRVVRIPWRFFQDARVSGLPMVRCLTINASLTLAAVEELPSGFFIIDYVVLSQFSFSTPLDQIATTIKLAAEDPAYFGHLPNWSDAGSADE